MRRHLRRLAPLALPIVLAACQSHGVCTTAGGPAAIAPPPDWRDAASDADHIKLREERAAFLDGLQQARAAGFGGAIDAIGGALFDPDYTLDDLRLAPGRYRCRAYTLGTKVQDRPAFVATPAHICTVAADGRLQRLQQDEGAQRVTGRLYPDGPSRTIFLGVLVLADEATALHYGRDADRDISGVVQRIGAARWRLVVPRPAWESTAVVVDITPAA